MWKVQSAESEIDYNDAVTAVRTKFKDDVAAYIGDIDPIYWNVFADIISGSY